MTMKSSRRLPSLSGINISDPYSSNNFAENTLGCSVDTQSCNATVPKMLRESRLMFDCYTCTPRATMNKQFHIQTCTYRKCININISNKIK